MEMKKNPAKRFFRRYTLTILGTILLFLLVNLLLAAAVLSAPFLEKNKRDHFSISVFSTHLSFQKGVFHADEEALRLLEREGAWAMLLDDAGRVVWEEAMPVELPRSYTVPETAVFSRWYLEDYPVTVWQREEGLLVVGFPPGSVFKYNISERTEYIRLLLAGVLAVFFLNLLFLLCLMLRNAGRVEKAAQPILDGITGLSEGEEVHLDETGELAEIEASLNRAGKRLMQKDQTRGEWIRGISHDIRTPLSMILGYASELEEDMRLPEGARMQACVIRRQGEKLKRLVDDLNLTTRLEYAVKPLRRQTLNPVEQGRQAVSEILNEGLPEQYDILWTESSESETKPGKEPKTVPFSGDPLLLQRMLGNLIRNCIVHNPQGCQIQVAVETQADRVVFSVSDNGAGMESQLLSALNQGRPVADASAADGTEHGLGLKIVRQIVNVHGGRLFFQPVFPHGLRVDVALESGQGGNHGS